MTEIAQKTIESFFADYGISDPDDKAKLLLEVTDIVYGYNMAIVKAEKETDGYKKKQALTGVEEWRAKIDDVFKDFLKKKK